MKKGIFHIHSTFSYDGISSISHIYNFAIKNNLDFIVITDHDTLKGSQELKKYFASKNNTNIEIPISAEYKTSYGDIIALNIKNEIETRDPFLLIDEIKRQGGLSVLPHPFDGHIHVDELASRVDVIEVFNARSIIKNNINSFYLALKYSKPMIWSSDSHVPLTLGNVIVGHEDVESFFDAIVNNRICPIVLKYSSGVDMLISQLKKAITQRNYTIIPILFLAYLKKLKHS